MHGQCLTPSLISLLINDCLVRSLEHLVTGVEWWSTQSRVSSPVMIYHVMSHLLSLITSVGSSVGSSLGNYVGNVTSSNDILATHNLFVSTVNVTEANFITIILS